MGTESDLNKNNYIDKLKEKEALELINKYKPKRSILTNLHVDLDYTTLLNETPDNVVPAHDGLQIKFKV